MVKGVRCMIKRYLNKMLTNNTYDTLILNAVPYEKKNITQYEVF